jgi:hypothetical protein
MWVNERTIVMEAEYTAVKVAKAVETLRARVAADKITRDVFHVMSLRERARNIITLGGLQQRMKKESYNYEMSDYIEVLKLMASLDFGTLMTDARGRVTGLKDISITLQSIGAAAMGQSDDLIAWKPRNKYVPLADAIPVEIAQPIREASKAKAAKSSDGAGYSVSITFVINGKPVNFPIPNDLNAQEIADLILRFRSE